MASRTVKSRKSRVVDPGDHSVGDGKLLNVVGLTTVFHANGRDVRAVDSVSFHLSPGETVCIVGESGSGKSVTSLSIMKLIENEGGRVVAGSIWFDGDDLLKASNEEMRRVRGRTVSMVFQEPMTALNPIFTVGSQISEAILLHTDESREQAWNRTVDMLRLVGIPEPEIRAKQYPHQLSGGMRQRVVVAMALVCNPKLLIADEPTTALDVTIQAQVLDLLRRLKRDLKMSILLITHDMGVAAEMADRVVVMYAGNVIEEGSVEEIFDRPLHPYTQGLLASIPGRNGVRGARLHAIAGSTPALADMPEGCRFNPRCPFAVDICRVEAPALRLVDGHNVACHRAQDAPVVAARTSTAQ
ncbi:MAG: oligopeptide/dipeptide transporter, ATPase subunit [Marmoricola sp.]|jgi:peptide/nickel transport system ATP-binding protein|nr:oligopeptide/dipeptide transporter, ATPase subunit [Marmoricola sp.]